MLVATAQCVWLSEAYHDVSAAATLDKAAALCNSCLGQGDAITGRVRGRRK